MVFSRAGFLREDCSPSLTALGQFLERAAPGRVSAAFELARMSRWRIGGPADFLVEPATVAELQGVMAVIGDAGVPHVVIGDTSNLLFDDSGVRGVVVRIARALSHIMFTADGQVRAGAGAWVPGFVRTVIQHGLSGCVHAIGIPGTLGGLVVMNGGSQRRGIGENVLTVLVLMENGHLATLSQADCEFGYRRSVLQRSGAIVLEVTFQFTPADARALRREAIGIMQDRRRKFPKQFPNCGSVFVSDPAMYATVGPPGRAIEDAGLKGLKIGDAQISPLHGNFIVNLGHARSADVLALIHEARERVHQRTGFYMDCEVRHVSPDGSVVPAHLRDWSTQREGFA